MALSDRLRELADAVEDTQIDDDRSAHVTMHMEFNGSMYDSYDASDVSWSEVDLDDPYRNTCQLTMFL